VPENQRQCLLDALQNGWGMYVHRFQELTPQQQTDFLTRQGYTSLAALLSHIIAWWDSCLQALPQMRTDPGYLPPQIDVDAFNAKAVARFSNLSESEVVCIFEARRTELLALVLNLPEESASIQGMLNRLEMEISGHLHEHALTKNSA